MSQYWYHVLMFDNLDVDANVDPKSTCSVKCLTAFGLFLKSFLYHVIIFIHYSIYLGQSLSNVSHKRISIL